MAFFILRFAVRVARQNFAVKCGRDVDHDEEYGNRFCKTLL